MMDFSWLSGLGNNAYSWAGDNPLGALSLGMGAAGTGMGIYDAYRSSQQQEQRRKLAESMMRMGPQAYNPNWSPQQLEARYFRPAATFSAERGITSGGAFRSALADAALKAELDRNQMGNQIFQSRLGALGYGQPRQASGSVGAFGGALQNLMMMNALRGRNQLPQSQTGATYNPTQYNPATFYQGVPAGWDSSWAQQQQDPYAIPSFQLQGSWAKPQSYYGGSPSMPGGYLPSGAPGDGRYGLTPFGESSMSMGDIWGGTAMPADLSGSY